MKSYKYKLLFILFLGGLLFTGCEDEFLTQTNPNSITPATFWNTEKDAQAALATVYGTLQFNHVSGALLTQEMGRSDLVGGNYWVQRVKPFSDFNVANNNSYVKDRWSEYYIGVNRANQVISNVPKMDNEVFSQVDTATIIAQAKFIRAYMYFRITREFGKAIMTTKATGLDEDIHMGFSTIAEVDSLVIIPDLEYAIAHLPEKWEGDDLGRATWGAAKTMLGKVYLFQEKWDMAATTFKEVMDKGLYGLTANFGDNFRHDTEYNEESIFEVAYETTTNPTASGQQHDDVSWDGGGHAGSEATGMGRMVGIWGAGAYAQAQTCYWLHELFVNDKPSSGSGYSPRLKASLAPRYEGDNKEEPTDLYYGITYQEMDEKDLKCWDSNIGETSYIKKNTNWYWQTAENPQDRSQINFRAIRYADVLLMYAEAILMRDGDPAFNEARDIIDLVRARAGVKTIKSFQDNRFFDDKFPQLHVSKQLHGAHPYVDPTAANLLIHLQRVERPLELAFEGHRFKDLVRWGIIKELFDELKADEDLRRELYTGSSDLNNPQKASGDKAPLYIRGTYRNDFQNNADVYSPDAHDYLPIPSSEDQNNQGY